MTELEILNNYKMGKFTGIVVTKNHFYVPGRITGTGITIRPEGLEDRVKSEFITPSFLAQCSNLPITLGHPSNLLSSKTIDEANIIGVTCGDAYVKGDEIWAIFKIYDNRLAQKVGKSKKYFSTSPGVLSLSKDNYSNIKYETPLEINHVAIVPEGHWDQVSDKAFEDTPYHDLESSMNNEEKQDQIVSQVEPSQKTDESSIEKLKEVEKEEGKTFEKLAEAHKNLDKEEKMEKEEVKKDETEEEVEKDETEEEVKKEEVKKEEVKKDDKYDIHSYKNRYDDEAEEQEDSEEEVIVSDEEVKEDALREETLAKMRELCDKAHPSLNVQMPFISKRETCRSIIRKFVNANLKYCPSKYVDTAIARLDAGSRDLFNEMLEGISKAILDKSQALGTKKVEGFADTGKGYSVDSSF